MPKMIFVNLPVKDLAAATRFYEAIGCTKNDQFSDHQASNMVWSEAIIFHLLTRDFFASFTPKPVAEAQKASEVLIALTMDSREEVDAIVEAAGVVRRQGRSARADGHGLALQPHLRGSRWPHIRSSVGRHGGGGRHRRIASKAPGAMCATKPASAYHARHQNFSGAME